MAKKNDLFDKYETIDKTNDTKVLTEEKNQKSPEDDKLDLLIIEEDEKEVTLESAENKKGEKDKRKKEQKPVKDKKKVAPKTVDEKKTKEKKVKQSAKDKKDLPFEEQLTKKDHFTFALVLITLVVAIAFVLVKFVIPLGNDNETENLQPTTKIENVSKISLHKEDVTVQYIQSDIKNIFYSWSPENAVQYYQYDDNKLKAISSMGSITAKVKMTAEELNVTVEYVKDEDKIFGIGLFSADQIEEESAYKNIVFKMTNLPKGYEEEGKALLLATVEVGETLGKYTRWTDSFVVDIESGETKRFLNNTTTEITEAASFSVLSDEAYTLSDGKIPFFTTRSHESISGKKDIYVKDGTKEYVVAEDVYGNYVLVFEESVVYLKSSESGFNVVRKDAEDETVVFNMNGDLNINYLSYNEFLLDKNSGKLYNMKTGAEIQVKDYKMYNPEYMNVSADGKWLVILGTEKNIVDYQLYIVNLATGDCTKYEDSNFSKHTDIMFINETVFMYTAISPEKGYENVIVDIAKMGKK